MRPATKDDAYAALRALRAMKLKSPALQMKYTDEDSALCHMLESVKLKKAVVVGGFFVLFDVGRPWYSKHNFLIEELIIRLSRTAEPVEVAIQALTTLAHEHNCVAVAAGDTQIGYMKDKYLGEGFSLLGYQFIKEA